MNSYRMKLLPRYFTELENGTKYIEIRCNDEKRQKIKPGDQIVFVNSVSDKEIPTVVLSLERHGSFEELIRKHPVEAFGFPDASVEEVVKAVDRIYTHEQERKYGALGIVLKTNKRVAVG